MIEDIMWLVESQSGKRTILAQRNNGVWYSQVTDEKLSLFFESMLEEFYENPRSYKIEYGTAIKSKDTSFI